MSYDVSYVPRYDHVFYPSDLVCTAALSLFAEVSGSGGLYGNAGAQWPFGSATAQTVGAMIAEQVAFWTTAQADFDTSTSLKGFSSATPRENFDSFPVDKGTDRLGAGTGSWWWGSTSGTDKSVSGLNYAIGLWALAEVSGVTQETVADVYPWLMSFTSNPTLEAVDREPTEAEPAGFEATPWTIANSRFGTYDPTIALAAYLLAERDGAPTAMNSSDAYMAATVGLLARIQQSANSGALDRAKKAFSNSRERGPYFGQIVPQAFDEPRLMGYCGLSFQLLDAVIFPISAAQFGLAYRFGNAFPTVRP